MITFLMASALLELQFATPEKLVLKPAPQQEEVLIAHKFVQRGLASWYGPGFHGRQTANGEKFNKNELTAAHRTLPFGTKVRVTNLNNGLSVIVRINDRGPFVRNRVIDLSEAAAREIGMINSGVVSVLIEEI